jgi:hypothetical protein
MRLVAEIARRRLESQRLSRTTFTKPEELVAWLGAVQAQDYLGALWAVGLRLVDACEPDVERALAERTIVRTWPMRGTLHFVAAADARWITELLAPRAVAAGASRLAAAGIDRAVNTKARRALERKLEGGRRLTRPAAYRVLEDAKIATGDSRGLHLLWLLAHDGVLCFGPREGKQQTFVLLEEWLPGARRLDREEALGELARRYFTGHGPATIADFAWWSGLTRSDASRAVLLAGKAIEDETIDGQRTGSRRRERGVDRGEGGPRMCSRRLTSCSWGMWIEARRSMKATRSGSRVEESSHRSSSSTGASSGRGSAGSSVAGWCSPPRRSQR